MGDGRWGFAKNETHSIFANFSVCAVIILCVWGFGPSHFKRQLVGISDRFEWGRSSSYRNDFVSNHIERRVLW